MKQNIVTTTLNSEFTNKKNILQVWIFRYLDWYLRLRMDPPKHILKRLFYTYGTKSLKYICKAILIKLQAGFSLKVQIIYTIEVVTGRCTLKKVFLVADRATWLTCTYTLFLNICESLRFKQSKKTWSVLWSVWVFFAFIVKRRQNEKYL